MPPALYDAHCHWQDARLAPHSAAIADALRQTELRRAVVNGTCPQDWEAVAELAKADSRVLPAFGVHPWHVNAVCGKAADERQNWLQALETLLAQYLQAAIGEIGLDRWIEDADIGLQTEAFLARLALAARDNRPVSIHCLRADADLLHALKAAPALPQRGIHLHGFAGSVETARQLLDYGAYFSFSEYIAEPKRVKARAVAAMIPLDRLLAETDSPDMAGPDSWQHYRLDNPATPLPPQRDTATAAAPKHPANITAAYACLVKLRGIPMEELAPTIEANFLRYFGG